MFFCFPGLCCLAKGVSVILINLPRTSARSSSRELNRNFSEMSSSHHFPSSGATPLPAAVTTAWMSRQRPSASCLTRWVSGNEVATPGPLPAVQQESIWGSPYHAILPAHHSPTLLALLLPWNLWALWAPRGDPGLQNGDEKKPWTNSTIQAWFSISHVDSGLQDGVERERTGSGANQTATSIPTLQLSRWPSLAMSPDSEP